MEDTLVLPHPVYQTMSLLTWLFAKGTVVLEQSRAFTKLLPPGWTHTVVQNASWMLLHELYSSLKTLEVNNLSTCCWLDSVFYIDLMTPYHPKWQISCDWEAPLSSLFLSGCGSSGTQTSHVVLEVLWLLNSGHYWADKNSIPSHIHNLLKHHDVAPCSPEDKDYVFDRLAREEGAGWL